MDLSADFFNMHRKCSPKQNVLSSTILLTFDWVRKRIFQIFDYLCFSTFSQSLKSMLTLPHFWEGSGTRRGEKLNYLEITSHNALTDKLLELKLKSNQRRIYLFFWLFSLASHGEDLGHIEKNFLISKWRTSHH